MTRLHQAARAAALLTSTAAVALAMPAYAQTGAVASDPVATAANPDDVGDIVVTATRRPESSKDVPLAVTAISGEKLDVLNSSGLDIRFLSSRTPSLQIESSFGRTFPRFYIRGLGNTDFDPNAAQPVSVVYDDVALENPMLKSFPVFDLQSVQVLRGPQGTLFGRNTPAGVVKLDSVKPGDTWTGYTRMSLATYNTLNVESAAGGPIGGGFGIRVSGLVQRRDNWVTNTAVGSGFADARLEGYNDRAARIQLSYAGPGFNALLNVHGRELDASPRVFRAGLFAKGSNAFNAGFDKDRVTLDGYTQQQLKQWGANLHLDAAVGGGVTFYSITAYERARVYSVGDIDGAASYPFTGGTLGAIGVGAFPSNTGGTTTPQEFSQELRFATDPMDGLRLQGGGYYFHQTLRYHEYNYVPATGSRDADNNQDILHDNVNENWGVFASAEYDLTSALNIRLGGRYSHDRRDDRVSGFSPNLFGYVLPVRAKAKAGEFTWDASATYALSPSVNLYARAATGYQGPAIQDRVTFGSRQSVAGKQTTISGEGGIKGDLIDRTLRFALDGYWFRTDDLQITAVGGTSNSARLLNADHAVGYGVEAEFEARPVAHLALTASGSYNFTEIRDPSIRIAPCGGGCTMVDPVAGGLASIDGNRLPQAPRWVANWTARYGVPLADGGEIYAYTDWAYRGRINYFLYDALEFRGRSSLEGGAKIGWRMGSGLEVAAFARNITNQIRSISAIDFNNLTGMINEPRIIGGEIGFKF